MEKSCSSCKCIKNVNLFNKDFSRVDGYSYICRECEHEKGASYRIVKSGIRKCSCCSEEKPLTSRFFHKNKSEKTGLAYMCKECIKQYNEKAKVRHYANRDRNLERMKVYGLDNVNRSKRLIRDYKRFDKTKGYDCDLNLEYVIGIVKSKCIYCGDDKEPIGCDRIDNKKGHTIKNTVPACITCNVSRMDNFTHEEMFIIGKSIREVKNQRSL